MILTQKNEIKIAITIIAILQAALSYAQDSTSSKLTTFNFQDSTSGFNIRKHYLVLNAGTSRITDYVSTKQDPYLVSYKEDPTVRLLGGGYGYRYSDKLFLEVNYNFLASIELVKSKINEGDFKYYYLVDKDHHLIQKWEFEAYSFVVFWQYYRFNKMFPMYQFSKNLSLFIGGGPSIIHIKAKYRIIGHPDYYGHGTANVILGILYPLGISYRVNEELQINANYATTLVTEAWQLGVQYYFN